MPPFKTSELAPMTILTSRRYLLLKYLHQPINQLGVAVLCTGPGTRVARRSPGNSELALQALFTCKLQQADVAAPDSRSLGGPGSAAGSVACPRKFAENRAADSEWEPGHLTGSGLPG